MAFSLRVSASFRFPLYGMHRVSATRPIGHESFFQASIGGRFVYRLAVAPEGHTGDWTTKDRKGGPLADLWGVCEVSDFSVFACVWWNEAEMTYEADRRQFDTILRRIAAEWPKGRPGARGFIPGYRRRVRAQVCACLAGPFAEQLFEGGEVGLIEEESENPDDDIHRAMGFSFLLPYPNEFRHACEVTVAALRRPDIWEHVMRLADELERVGDMTATLDFLPDPMPGWPPSPGSRAQRKAK